MNEHVEPAQYNSLKRAEPSLPARWYYDDEHYRQELTRLWYRNWVYVCRSSALTEPMSFRTLRIGDQSVIVVRDGESNLQAYHNTCPHRGSQLCEATSGRLGSKLLVCPYHQWSFAADDGRLVRVSSFAEPEGFCKSDHGLYKVALAEWRGSVFVNLNPEAIWGSEAAFQRPPDIFERFPLEAMVVGETWRKEISCNWKSFWENFNECLHCPNVHPELSDLVPLYSRRIIDPKDVPDWTQFEGSDDPRYRGGLRPGAETWSSDSSAQEHLISTLTEDGFARGQAYASTWPSMFIGGYADHVRIVRLLPLGPERIELQAEWLFEPETLADSRYDKSNVVEFAKLVMEQDGRACEVNQKGLHALPFKQGVLMPEEYLLKRFHDWVRNGLTLE
ncbi:MAG: aromatic ring-hydroxylating dioxygenase subunit alpha [Anderseniella sp.]|jgi:Rieske 2Fe-2S family protein|nr:aromatic ring-hydroxylating dioxygenase subunit alpha [Anderseniella sp.]